MTVDMDVLHSAFQYPTTIVEYMVGVMLLMRSATMVKQQAKMDPILTKTLGWFLIAIALKQNFWSIQGALQAVNLFDSSAELSKGHWFPIVMNVSITILGCMLLGLVGRQMIGRAAIYMASGSAFGLVAIGFTLATRG